MVGRPCISILCLFPPCPSAFPHFLPVSVFDSFILRTDFDFRITSLNKLSTSHILLRIISRAVAEPLLSWPFVRCEVFLGQFVDSFGEREPRCFNVLPCRPPYDALPLCVSHLLKVILEMQLDFWVVHRVLRSGVMPSCSVAALRRFSDVDAFRRLWVP